MKLNFTSQKKRCLPGRLWTFLLACTFIMYSTKSQAEQHTMVVIEKGKLEQAITKIRTIFKVVIAYNKNDIANVTVNAGTYKDQTVEEVLMLLLKETPITYKKNGTSYVLLKAKTPKTTAVLPRTPGPGPVSGSVTDSQGEPLPGVIIVVKGTVMRTNTDSEGTYSFSRVPGNAILVFSLVGMKKQELPVAGRSKVNVVLDGESVSLDEVVAVGYGTVRKSDLTGSVATINVENAPERAVTSIEQLLQGKAAGVQITNNTGAPGGGITFSIRGVTSVSGSNQPLIVIDGYPIDSDNSAVKETTGNQSGYLSDQPQDNALASLNPGDIESVEILKDASAAAIYGSRATNGVVLITTKRGKEGAPRIDYYYRTDVSKISKKIDVLGTSDYLNYINEANLNSGLDSAYTAATIARYSGTNTNWQDLIYRTAISQNHQLNISGGSGKTKYSVSLGYLGQEGLIRDTRFDRGSIRVNLDQEINRKLKFGLNISGVSSKDKSALQSPNRGEASWSSVLGVLTSRPFDSPYTAEDEIDQTQVGNPLTLVDKTDDENRVTTVLANMFAEYLVTEGLTFRVNGGVNTSSSHRDFYLPRGTSLGNSSGGYAYSGYANSFNYLTEYTLSYNKTLNKKHKLNAVMGYTWQEWTRRNFGINATGFPNDNLSYYDLSSAVNVSSPATMTTQWALSSFIGRMNYSFDDRYLFTFTGRSDGSTRLANGNKWDFFPSVAVGWNLHNEAFMKDIPYLSSLKLRASYGLSGNQVIAVGATKAKLNSTSSVVNESVQIGYNLANLPNSSLHWETTKQTNIGLDLSLFNNRLSFGFDYYNKFTEDLLINLNIPPVNGFTSYTTNQGSVRNTGYEFNLAGKILTGKFNWDISGNLSFNKNKLINLGAADSFVAPPISGVSNQSLNIAKVGYPIGAFYGYRMDGIYQNQAEIDAGPVDLSANPTPGSFKYKDISGPKGVPDGKIDAFDREIIGSPYPDCVFGITNDFKWKAFDLSVFIYSSLGQDVINANRHFLDALSGGNVSNISQKAYDNRWTGEGTSNTYPEATATASRFNDRFTDFIVEDASFVRLKNVTFSYNMTTKRMVVKNIKLFVSAENLVTLTRYTGYDPEINSKGDNSMTPGIDFGSIPQYRTFSAGINFGL